MTFEITIATAVIFVLTYAGVSLGRIPGLRLDRAGIALTGAALMMAVGAITPEDAYRAINLDTLALLLGMMIVVAHLRLSGFFRLVTGVARCSSPSVGRGPNSRMTGFGRRVAHSSSNAICCRSYAGAPPTS